MLQHQHLTFLSCLKEKELVIPEPQWCCWMKVHGHWLVSLFPTVNCNCSH